jgi:hypothetical protein
LPIVLRHFLACHKSAQEQLKRRHRALLSNQQGSGALRIPTGQWRAADHVRTAPNLGVSSKELRNVATSANGLMLGKEAADSVLHGGEYTSVRAKAHRVSSYSSLHGLSCPDEALEGMTPVDYMTCLMRTTDAAMSSADDYTARLASKAEATQYHSVAEPWDADVSASDQEREEEKEEVPIPSGHIRASSGWSWSRPMAVSPSWSPERTASNQLASRRQQRPIAKYLIDHTYTPAFPYFTLAITAFVILALLVCLLAFDL